MNKRNILNLNENNFIKKFAIQCGKLVNKMRVDEYIYGDGFMEFTERKIEVVLPARVNILHKKGKITGYKVGGESSKMNKDKLKEYMAYIDTYCILVWVVPARELKQNDEPIDNTINVGSTYFFKKSAKHIK